MSTASPTELQGGFAANTVVADGQGSPVVFLHGPFGPEWPGFLDDLAGSYRVLAPAHPGTIDPDDLGRLDSIHELVLYYDDLFEALGLGQVDLVGHSFGGMVAAEIAATYRDRVRKLVLIDPMGLWRDDAPVEDHVASAPEKVVAMLYHDPSLPEVAAKLQLPEDPIDNALALVSIATSVAATSHFIWPIPERGLDKRLRRIRAETLVVWGREDGLVPPVYADDFVAGIASARSVIVANAGHYPHLEAREEVTRAVRDFLG
jgi:pimeloyl-ACP methyl ester carboxylesterase